jgi:hypothetical protein
MFSVLFAELCLLSVFVPAVYSPGLLHNTELAMHAERELLVLVLVLKYKRKLVLNLLNGKKLRISQ